MDADKVLCLYFLNKVKHKIILTNQLKYPALKNLI